MLVPERPVVLAGCFFKGVRHALGGEEGVKLYIDKIGAELEDTMAMCGAKTLADISRDMVFMK